MPRDFQINGAAMVAVKSDITSSIGQLTNLGLPDGPIDVSFEHYHNELKTDATGEAPVDVQFMNWVANLSMSLIHVDPDVLEVCQALSLGGAASVGTAGVVGARLGNGVARFAPGNRLIGLNIAAPINGRPYRFFCTYLANNPISIPLGAKASSFRLNWRAIPYMIDPWNGGTTTLGIGLYDHVLDT